jgi:hypothetical protein
MNRRELINALNTDLATEFQAVEMYTVTTGSRRGLPRVIPSFECLPRLPHVAR